MSVALDFSLLSLPCLCGPLKKKEPATRKVCRGGGPISRGDPVEHSAMQKGTRAHLQTAATSHEGRGEEGERNDGGWMGTEMEIEGQLLVVLRSPPVGVAARARDARGRTTGGPFIFP